MVSLRSSPRQQRGLHTRPTHSVCWGAKFFGVSHRICMKSSTYERCLGGTSSLLGLIITRHDITRHDGSHRGGHLMVQLVGKIEPGKNSSPLFTESVID